MKEEALRNKIRFLELEEQEKMFVKINGKEIERTMVKEKKDD